MRCYGQRRAPGDKRLFAYVVPENEVSTPEVLRQYLQQRLPEYMLPSVVRRAGQNCR